MFCYLEPGVIPGLSHELILHPTKQKKKFDVETYITLKWKPPLNSSDIYSYQFLSIATLSVDWCGKKTPQPFPVPALYYQSFTILMEGDVLENYLTTGFIMTKAMKLRENAKYYIVINAKNVKGASTAVDSTKCEFIIKVWILFRVFRSSCSNEFY